MPPLDPRRALVLNKRQVARIEIPAAHTLTTYADGWRIDFTDSGEIRVIGATGNNDVFSVASGDYVISNGEEYYVSRLKGGNFPGGGA